MRKCKDYILSGTLCLILAMVLSLIPCNAVRAAEDYNLRGYAELYPDLMAAFGYDEEALLNHYLTYGINEGRTMPTHAVMAEAVNYDGLVQDMGVSNGYLGKVLGYWAWMPDNWKQDFLSQGWHVEVAPSDPVLPGYPSRIVALTSFDRKTIFIGPRDSSAIVHEMGHYLDYRKGFCHNRLPDETYQAEKGAAMTLGGGSASNYGNKQEYLAECYFLYLKNNAGFRAACLGTCAFIEAELL